MIAKKDLKSGYYKGVCRATFVAYWYAKQDCFMHLNWNFGVPYVETIKHIEDVIDKTDGFVPVEAIEKLDKETYQKAVADSGY